MSMTEQTQAPAPRRQPGSRRWPAIIIALIGLQLTLGAITIYFATNDPSFALEPDAYDKALHWDEQVRAQQASAALGWSYELRIGDPDTFGDRDVFLNVTDAAGQPLELAAVSGVAFHQARAAQRLALDFRAVSPGLYRTKAKLRRDGQWAIRLEVQRDDDVFLIDTTTYVGQWRPSMRNEP